MSKRILGVSDGYGLPDYNHVKESGLEWVRWYVPFPWQDKLFGTPTEYYLKNKEHFRDMKRAGLKTMAFLPCIGSWRWDEAQKANVWQQSIPDWMGAVDTKEFLDHVTQACAWVVDDMGDLIDDLWQTSNEMDITTFRGNYTLDEAAHYMIAQARGIKEARPNALVGINPAHMQDEARYLFDQCYNFAGSPFNYAGIDGYYGSWAGHSVEHWIPVIDEIQRLTRRPVLISEWGYSSGGKVIPKPDDYVQNGDITSVCDLKCWHNAYKGESEHTEALQAEYLEIGLKLFATYPDLLGNFVFCWKDGATCYHCGQSECPAECFWGVVHQDESPKPAYYVIQQMAKEYYK